MPFASIDSALAAFARGGIVLVMDDEDRENEGDLIVAAEHATPETIAFFIRYTSGLLCAAVTEQRADELELPLMVERNTENQRTAFTVTVDLLDGTTTGISASDRSLTARSLVDRTTRPEDYARPGHLHVLRARDGGVLARPGHTEAAVDLARLSGCEPAGVLAEVVTADSLGMARREELEAFAAEHDLPLITIADLVRFREREVPVRRAARTRVPTPHAVFTCDVYESPGSDAHLAFTLGEVTGRDDVLVRIHSECLTGDVFGSLRCDCGEQLQRALEAIAREGAGVLVYLRGHEGRGVGIVDKLRAYELQDGGLDTVDANVELGLPVDAREYGIGAQILRDLGVGRIRLMTNNPAKRAALEAVGLDVVERVPLEVRPNHDNARYLATKRDRLGHILHETSVTRGTVRAARNHVH